MNIKCPGHDDNVLHKSEVVRFGASAESKIPLIQFVDRKTVINHHGKIQRHMNIHQKGQCAKLKGEKTTRKRIKDSPTNPNFANLLKVNRTKVPPRRKIVQSPKKGRIGANSKKKATPLEEDEDNKDAAQMQRILDDNEDSDYSPQEDFDLHEVVTGKKPRRSKRPNSKPQKYGHSETLTTDDDTEESGSGSSRKHFTGTPSHQPATTTQDDSQVMQVVDHPANPAHPLQERDQESTVLQPPLAH